MICGTFLLEDLTVHFELPSTKDGQVRVQVQNGLDGEAGLMHCSPRAFAASMALALDFDGFEDSALSASLYEAVEGIEWISNGLRWIP